MTRKELQRGRRLIAHIGRVVKDIAASKRFHVAVLQALNISLPGYAAFVIDADGNNIEAVFHGPGQEVGRFREGHIRRGQGRARSPVRS